MDAELVILSFTELCVCQGWFNHKNIYIDNIKKNTEDEGARGFGRKYEDDDNFVLTYNETNDVGVK